MIAQALLLVLSLGVTECQATEPIELGQVATCSGILFPVEWAKQAGENKLTIQEMQIQLSECHQQTRINDEACAAKVKALEKIANSYSDLASKSLEHQPEPQWYQDPITAASAGFVLGLVAGVYLVIQK